MESVTALVAPERLKAIAPAEDFSSGQLIAQSGGVTITVFHRLEVAARVIDPAALHLVTLKSGLNGLTWSCTCYRSVATPPIFCAHAVAVGLAAWDRSWQAKK
jgi:hypothetical protein